MEPVDYASVCILNVCDPARKDYRGSYICTGRTEAMWCYLTMQKEIVLSRLLLGILAQGQVK